MDKYIYNEKNGLWYEVQGNYYLPCLKLPEERTAYIGIWGQRHLRYLKQHRKGLYSELLISGKLNDYLADLNEQAEELFSRLVKQLAEKEGVTEALKAENQMLWVQKMNTDWLVIQDNSTPDGSLTAAGGDYTADIGGS
jgi:hypothetical protein ELI_0507